MSFFINQLTLRDASSCSTTCHSKGWPFTDGIAPSKVSCLLLIGSWTPTTLEFLHSFSRHASSSLVSIRNSTNTYQVGEGGRNMSLVLWYANICACIQIHENALVYKRILWSFCFQGMLKLFYAYAMYMLHEGLG